MFCTQNIQPKGPTAEVLSYSVTVRLSVTVTVVRYATGICCSLGIARDGHAIEKGCHLRIIVDYVKHTVADTGISVMGTRKQRKGNATYTDFSTEAKPKAEATNE